jgi:hypothetical protein
LGLGGSFNLLRTVCSDVIKALRRCYKGGTKMLKRCYKGNRGGIRVRSFFQLSPHGLQYRIILKEPQEYHGWSEGCHDRNENYH